MGRMCKRSNCIHKMLLNTRGTVSIIFLVKRNITMTVEFLMMIRMMMVAVVLEVVMMNTSNTILAVPLVLRSILCII